MVRVLVVGADGMIGKALAGHLSGLGHEVVATTRRPDGGGLFLDLADPGAARIPPVDGVALCAGAAGLAACRDAPERSRQINVEGPLALAAALAARDRLVVGVSTNLVFDGSLPHAAADRPPCPACAYGRQKAELETGLAALGGAVLRLGKVLGPGHALLAGWRRDLAAGRPIRAFTDLVMAPVGLSAAIAALADILVAGRPGRYQLTASRDLTYHAAALALAERLGAGSALVEPASAAAAGLPAGERPPHATLKATPPWTAPDPLDAVWEALT